MSDDEVEIDRPPMWWYWKSPALLAAIVIGAAVTGTADLLDMVGPATVLFIVWLAWSMVSGLYPWSMRP